jgi:hypothetical protein
MRFLRRLYGLLLTLYPRKYRDEYGKELQDVFNLSVDDALEKGTREVTGVILRELIALPGAILYEHLRERRNAAMKRSFGSYFDFPYGSWKEFLTALLPFFFAGGLIPALNYLGRAGITSNAVGTVIMLTAFGLLLILLVVGAKKGMPRWSLPYLGFLFSILSVYLFSAVFGTPIYLLFRNLRDQSLLFIDILWSGIFWYGLLTAMILLVLLSRTSSALHHFRKDWTLLCFVLYGAVPFALWLTFDEYVGDEPYMLLSFLILACGAALYLRTNSEWMRFGMLFGAMTLAMLIVTAGKAALIPMQTWPITIDAGLVRAEVKSTIMMWMWFTFGMLIPLGIKLLPHSDASIHVSPSSG